MTYSDTLKARLPLSLYVHIPFCETKCPYCDFNTYANIDSLISGYVTALNREVRLWGDILGHPAVATVFIGGGTPSYLPEDCLVGLMQSIDEAFEIRSGAEVTLEANPDDVNKEKLSAYLKVGVNRLSIGVQALEDRLLTILGRRHSAADAANAYHIAREAGFENVNLDLMYGLPHQSIGDWDGTLSAVSALAPDHVSMYCLTLESGTPMEQWVGTGSLPNPDPDLAADMYLMAQDKMHCGGLRHYEISNWAVPGKESRHNLTYWRNESYLGVGPGAHSYLGNYRFFNLKSPRVYVKKLGGSDSSYPDTSISLLGNNGWVNENVLTQIPVVESVDFVDRRLQMAETMMMGMRLEEGISNVTFLGRFGETPFEVYGDIIGQLTDDGLVIVNDGVVRLTGMGKLLGNEVFGSFLENDS